MFPRLRLVSAGKGYIGALDDIMNYAGLSFVGLCLTRAAREYTESYLRRQLRCQLFNFIEVSGGQQRAVLGHVSLCDIAPGGPWMNVSPASHLC